MYPSFYKALVPASFLLLQSASAQGGSCQSLQTQITHYGLGSAGVYTAFECPGQAAGSRTYEGDGSYGNPGAAAVTDGDPKYPRCSIVYVPRYKKYFRINDKCAGCDSAKLDLWIGPSPGPSDTDATVGSAPGRPAAAACEIQFGTTGATVILNPPSNLPVQTKGLYDGTCHNNDASYVFGDNTATCSGGGSEQQQPGPSSPAAAAPAASSPPPRLGGKPVEALVVHDGDNTPSSTADPLTVDTSLPTIPKFGDVERLADTNPKPSSSLSAIDPVPTGSTSTTTTTGGRQKGDPCPPNDWFPGCVWGSGAGQLGATCAVKMDCFGDFVCIGGKCTNNVNPGNKAKRSIRHWRRHLSERAAVEGVKH